SADERFDATFHTSVLVNHTGGCQYIPPGILKSSCKIDVRWFPFDVQSCDLKFGSWTHDGWLIDLHLLHADTSGYLPNGEWDLIGVVGKRNELFYECCQEPYTDVTYTLLLRRRTLYYALNLLLPCMLISALALLVFLLPAESGEKISLGITVLLSLTVFMLLVAEIMPATSDSVPLIGQYFASTLMIVGFSVVVTVLVLQCHHHDPDGTNMPTWVRVLLVHWCAWLLRMKQPVRDARSGGPHGSPAPWKPPCLSEHPGTGADRGQVTTATQPHNHSHNNTRGYTGNHNPDNTYAQSQPLNYSQPFNHTHNHSTTITNTQPHSQPPNHTDNHPIAQPRTAAQHHEDSCCPGCPNIAGAAGGEGGGAARQESPLQSCELAGLLAEVHYLAERMRAADAGARLGGEWRFAAAVIDRLCLIAFSIVTISSTAAILVSAPSFMQAITKDFG
uniref:Uncharacterized protein n=1 Tax=Petromyzon marinus TaxID=7757 RepID=S4R4M0_PETMA